MSEEALELITPDPHDPAEEAACTPAPLDPAGINPRVVMPYGCTGAHVLAAMQEFIDWLEFLNTTMATRDIQRIETMLMPANFSSMVGEFMSSTIPKHCPTITKNTYHNGHPDLIPTGFYPGDSVLHGPAGIEIKGSRYLKAWQGHNPEDVFLLVFCFDSNRPVDVSTGVAPKPFRFLHVLGAEITKDDWKFAGRSETSRRTITATVLPTGYAKMAANTIYRDPTLRA